MGDRYQRTKPTKDKRDAEKSSKKSRKLAQNESSKYELSKLKGQSLLSEGIGDTVRVFINY
jgi:hypothetical protein